MQILPQISIQPDWHEAVRDVVGQDVTEESFWASCYKKGGESIHGSVTISKGSQPRSVNLKGSDGIAVEYINSRSFKMGCKSLDISDVMIYGPKLEFDPKDNKPVNAIDVTSDGDTYALGQTNRIIIGSLKDGKEERVLQGHLDDVTTVEFFPSNQVILSGGADFQVKIWSAIDGSNPVTLVGHTSAITDTAIIGRGRNVLSSSRDGTIRLWHCGTGATISIVAQYNVPVTKILLCSLPSQYPAATPDQLDEREVETNDKMVLAALGDGSVVGIHLGTKKELFRSEKQEAPLTALANHTESGVFVIGDIHGNLSVYNQNEPQNPCLQWHRSEHAVTDVVVKLDEDGEWVVFVANADGSLYRTSAILTAMKQPGTLRLAGEYTGSELETIHCLKAIASKEENGHERLICSNRTGHVMIY
ncbi:WD40 repeat-like protein [Lichtheimia hyalospora FSU 10163]|nr:WD40 repeat-like protein [Lichtheimia hyalospora FSU 10163]